MSDSLTAGGGPITRKIDGRDVRFGELSFYDRAELAKEFRRKKREEKVALLNESLSMLGAEHAAAVSQMRHDELAAFDKKYIGDHVWFDFFNSDEGKLAILEKSLRNANEDPMLARKYGGKDVMELCAALTYTPLKPVEDKENPQTPNAQEKTKAFGEE